MIAVIKHGEKVTYREMTAEEREQRDSFISALPKSSAATLDERVRALEAQVEQLMSFVNSLGKTELVGKGTAGEPFEWAAGIELIPNAYYLYGGVRYVWMGAAGTATADNFPADVGGEWAEF